MAMKLPVYPAMQRLRAMGSWRDSVHVFDEQQRLALHAAEATGRPLLVRGEPGTGKSQLAHAAAVAAQRRFISFVVDSRTEPSDLMWRYDAVARLADAQMAGLDHGRTRALEATNYLRPGPLWWAFNPSSAREHIERLPGAPIGPEAPPPEWNWSPAAGTVLLIDEIDKAEAEVPNGLLEALNNGSFSIPQIDRVVERAADAPAPLVVITSNDERELPAPFLRRCLVLTLALPEKDEELVEMLIQRAEQHFPAFVANRRPAVEDAARMLTQDRRAATDAGVYRPGLAEFLDLIRALQDLPELRPAQLELLRGFTFSKQPRT
jgi:MoxR-like ATPase